MDQRDTYVPAGQTVRLLPVPYVLNLVLLLIWPLLGSIALLVYWTLVLILARRIGSLATIIEDPVLSSASTWLFLSAFAGLGTTIVNVLMPSEPHLVEMNAILDVTVDPELALQLIAPYMVDIMKKAMVVAPMQIMIPSAFGFLGWIKFRSHVIMLVDVQRYVVEEGVQKLLVAHKLQLITSFLLVGTIASIWGAFASIIADMGTNVIAIMVLLIATFVLGIGTVITTVASFFIMVAGCSKTGNALLLIKNGRTVARCSANSVAALAEMRCVACGNTFQRLAGIKYCPVCGAALP